MVSVVSYVEAAQRQVAQALEPGVIGGHHLRLGEGGRRQQRWRLGVGDERAGRVARGLG